MEAKWPKKGCLPNGMNVIVDKVPPPPPWFPAEEVGVLAAKGPAIAALSAAWGPPDPFRFFI